MNEYIYRIESPITGEIREFTAFKTAYKHLKRLRNEEGENTWPYLIKNTKTGRTHNYLVECKRKNKLHLAMLWSRSNKILDAVDLLDDDKALHPTAINVYNFARDMKVSY